MGSAGQGISADFTEGITLLTFAETPLEKIPLSQLSSISLEHVKVKIRTVDLRVMFGFEFCVFFQRLEMVLGPPPKSLLLPLVNS